MTAQQRDRERQAAVRACIDAIAALTAEGVDRQVLDRVGERLSALAARADLFDIDRFPPAADSSVPTAVYTLHVGADGSLPLQLLSARPVPGAAIRAANKPHLHPTWAAAACIRGCTRERLWLRTGRGDELQAQPERTLSPQGGAFTMMQQDIHSVRGDDTAPAMHLLLYGQVFRRAVLFEPDSWHAHEYAVPAIGT